MLLQPLINCNILKEVLCEDKHKKIKLKLLNH